MVLLIGIASVGSKTIRIDAFLWPATLTDDTDVPEYKDAYHDAPVHYAAYRMYRMVSHLRQSWRIKAAEEKALFDELVLMAKDDLSTQDDNPMQPIDVTMYE